MEKRIVICKSYTGFVSILINAWTIVMHYFFHFAIYNEGLKSVLLYIMNLLLTVLSKAEFFLRSNPQVSFCKSCGLFFCGCQEYISNGVWFPRNIFIICFAVPYNANLIVLKIKTIFSHQNHHSESSAIIKPWTAEMLIVFFSLFILFLRHLW